MHTPSGTTSVLTTDERWMAEAIAEATRELGRTGPNPAVGAVLVHGETVVGRGRYRHGDKHAEIVAMDMAVSAAAGVPFAECTLYCTLEPHSYQGRNPPCTDAILARGVGAVVYGCVDPNPRVAGAGIAQLRARIAVRGPVHERACQELIADFSLSLREHRPYVVGKAAISLDGRIATAGGESQWITGELARARGRELRAHAQAIIVGVETVLADDPQLTARTGEHEPLRVVLDRRLRTPRDAKLVRGPAPGALLVTSKETVPSEWEGADVWYTGTEPAAVLARLHHELGFTRVLIEGGAQVLGSFIAAGLIDELHLFVAPLILGGGPTFVGDYAAASLADALHLSLHSSELLGADLHLTLRT